MSHQEIVADRHSGTRNPNALPERIDEAIVSFPVGFAARVAVAKIIHVTIDFDLLPAADGSTCEFPRYLCAMWDGATSACERVHAIVICHRPLQSAALFLVISTPLVCIINVAQSSTATAPVDVVARTTHVEPRGAFTMAVSTCSKAIDQPA